MPVARPVSSPPDFLSQQVTAARRFYLDLTPRPTKGLTVVCGGWEECAPDYTIDRATFPYLSIEFVAAGRGELLLAGRRHELGPARQHQRRAHGRCSHRRRARLQRGG